MKSFCRLLSAAAMTLAAVPVLGNEIVACVVAPLENNPNYFGAATTATRLKCEFTNQDIYPTLLDLYRQGWSLIQVIKIDQSLGKNNQVISPLYLLEHRSDTLPKGAAKPDASAKGEAKPEKKR